MPARYAFWRGDFVPARRSAALRHAGVAMSMFSTTLLGAWTNTRFLFRSQNLPLFEAVQNVGRNAISPTLRFIFLRYLSILEATLSVESTFWTASGKRDHRGTKAQRKRGERTKFRPVSGPKDSFGEFAPDTQTALVPSEHPPNQLSFAFRPCP